MWVLGGIMNDIKPGNISNVNMKIGYWQESVSLLSLKWLKSLFQQEPVTRNTNPELHLIKKGIKYL